MSLHLPGMSPQGGRVEGAMSPQSPSSEAFPPVIRAESPPAPDPLPRWPFPAAKAWSAIGDGIIVRGIA